MFLAPGHAYIFFNYGAPFMLNVSGEPEGTAGGPPLWSRSKAWN